MKPKKFEVGEEVTFLALSPWLPECSIRKAKVEKVFANGEAIAGSFAIHPQQRIEYIQWILQQPIQDDTK